MKTSTFTRKMLRSDMSRCYTILLRFTSSPIIILLTSASRTIKCGITVFYATHSSQYDRLCSRYQENVFGGVKVGFVQHIQQLSLDFKKLQKTILLRSQFCSYGPISGNKSPSKFSPTRFHISLQHSVRRLSTACIQQRLLHFTSGCNDHDYGCVLFYLFFTHCCA